MTKRRTVQAQARAAKRAQRLEDARLREKYAQQRAKLLRAIETVKAAPSMHGVKWKEGQLKHYEKMLAELDASAPK